MDFQATLQAKAKESGQRVLKAEDDAKPVEKHETMSGFAAALNKKKQESDEKIATDKAESLIVVTQHSVGYVPTWSFSTVKEYEECPHRVKRDKVDGEKRPQSSQAERGNNFHDMCEAFVRGEIDELTGDSRSKLGHFAPDFTQLKRLFKEGKVSCEENWGIRKDWSPCDWYPFNPEDTDPELWGKSKLDAFVLESETSCRIIDYKTGRKFGNEMKHKDQGLCYALFVYHRHPEIESFTIEFWYLDQADKLVHTWTREQLTLLLPHLNNRARALTSDKKFPPRPNINSCRFCAYGCNKNAKGEPYGLATCDHDYYRSVKDVV